MIVSIWVFLIMGEPMADHPGTPYVQATASSHTHDYAPAREELEEACENRFHLLYPEACICESGWHRQEVRVMGS